MERERPLAEELGTIYLVIVSLQVPTVQRQVSSLGPLSCVS